MRAVSLISFSTLNVPFHCVLPLIVTIDCFVVWYHGCFFLALYLSSSVMIKSFVFNILQVHYYMGRFEFIFPAQDLNLDIHVFQ